MGMPIILDIPSRAGDAIFKDIFTFFHSVDARFSPYKSGSELSGYQSGEIPAKALSADMKRVIRECQKAQELTGGYFSAYFSGRFDPTGYVKGWAISSAAGMLKLKNIGTFCLSAGGDILARSNSDKIWHIGLQDPKDKKNMIAHVRGRNLAVATSGSYERGEHIINPKSGKPAKGLISVSVVGPDIVKADILATAAFCMGKRGIVFIDAQPGYEAMAIDRHGNIDMTGGMSKLLNL